MRGRRGRGPRGVSLGKSLRCGSSFAAALCWHIRWCTPAQKSTKLSSHLAHRSCCVCGVCVCALLQAVAAHGSLAAAAPAAGLCGSGSWQTQRPRCSMLPTLQQCTRWPSWGPAAQQWHLSMCRAPCMCGLVPPAHNCRPLYHSTQQNRVQQLSRLWHACRLSPRGRPLLLALRRLGWVTGASGRQQVV